MRNLPALRILVRPGDLRPVLEPLLDECSLPADDMRDLLIGAFVGAFADKTLSEAVTKKKMLCYNIAYIQ